MISRRERATDEAREILSHGVPTGENPIIGPSLLNMDPPSHTRLRELMNRAFTPARVAEQEAYIRRVTHELIDAFLDDGRGELVSQLSDLLPLRVILNLVGVPRQDMMQMKRWSSDSFALLFGRVPPQDQPRLARSAVELQLYCRDLIEQRRKEPREDLTSWLIAADSGGELLSEVEIISAIQGSLLAAGHETTTAMPAGWPGRLRLLATPHRR